MDGDRANRSGRGAGLTRRRWLAGASAITCAALLPLRPSRAAERAAASAPGTLILLGTQGGPNFSATRAETASALQVGERLYLVDCGYGTRAGLQRAGLAEPAIDAIFLTHLHDDHTADLPAILTHMATQGRARAITIYGPAGTHAMVAAIRAVLAPNAAIRTADEGRPAGFLDFITSVEATPAETVRAPFLEDGAIKVSCARNTHYPASIGGLSGQGSYAYRFDWDRSVVFSGDTTYSDGLVELARGADVLVCEVLEPVAMRMAFDLMVAGGAFAGAEEGVWQHMLATHASPAQVGQMAAEAGIGRLVLNHIAPGALLELPDSAFTDPIGRRYSGPVVVGRDGMVVEI